MRDETRQSGKTRNSFIPVSPVPTSSSLPTSKLDFPKGVPQSGGGCPQSPRQCQLTYLLTLYGAYCL
ncbi:hypothetical protein ATANTOWER_029256 [Ataeniobius toweri]|uniref:Uncharacterized protein n=1 Tax=Ataeniobius toweri TaxID=208326 RepID=A0ABU7AD40_9TELE|nr:hypothetical protein [Ataeniobius toweri]